MNKRYVIKTDKGYFLPWSFSSGEALYGNLYEAKRFRYKYQAAAVAKVRRSDVSPVVETVE